MDWNFIYLSWQELQEDVLALASGLDGNSCKYGGPVYTRAISLSVQSILQRESRILSLLAGSGGQGISLIIAPHLITCTKQRLVDPYDLSSLPDVHADTTLSTVQQIKASCGQKSRGIGGGLLGGQRGKG